MPWPQIIELHNRVENTTYDGIEVINTWYLEPFDSAQAFVSSMLGRVDGNVRTFPAKDYKYNFCYAAACDVVPYDPRSFSYMGRTNFQVAGPNLAGPNAGGSLGAGLQAVNTAVSSFQPINANGNLATNQFLNASANMPWSSPNYSAGAFVEVTYLPVISYLAGGSTISDDVAFNYINPKFEPRDRTNVINAGLRLQALNAFNFLGWYPESGVAPVVHEQYEHFTIERRMLNVNTNLSAIGAYINNVNQFPTRGGPHAPAGLVLPLFVKGTLKFVAYDTNYIVVPIVNDAGNPNGFNKWMNIKLHFDWRIIQSAMSYAPNAFNPAAPNKVPIEWNQVLAYPGLLGGLLVGNTLGWYFTKYSVNGLWIATADPYPYNTIEDLFETNF